MTYVIYNTGEVELTQELTMAVDIDRILSEVPVEKLIEALGGFEDDALEAMPLGHILGWLVENIDGTSTGSAEWDLVMQLVDILGIRPEPEVRTERVTVEHVVAFLTGNAMTDDEVTAVLDAIQYLYANDAMAHQRINAFVSTPPVPEDVARAFAVVADWTEQTANHGRRFMGNDSL